jgi:hypothetical protein
MGAGILQQRICSLVCYSPPLRYWSSYQQLGSDTIVDIAACTTQLCVEYMFSQAQIRPAAREYTLAT